MKIDDNGVIREMTEEEVKKLKEMQAKLQPIPISDGEKIEKLEKKFEIFQLAFDEFLMGGF